MAGHGHSPLGDQGCSTPGALLEGGQRAAAARPEGSRGSAPAGGGPGVKNRDNRLLMAILKSRA